MSRLRRLFLSDRYFFETTRLEEARIELGDADFKLLARALERVRARHRFTLTAWVFLPDHWHAILYPPFPLTISKVMKAVKVSSMRLVNRRRGERGELWQERFFDHALRTVREYMDTVGYLHLNPVRRGLVMKPEDWRWSSASEYSGVNPPTQEWRCGLTIDRVRLPADPKAQL